MKFSKMHGLGNDFMIIDGITQHVVLSQDVICRLSNRYYGVGFDQLLIVELSNNLEIDFFYRIFNANGKEVNQCGNGIRCFAKFVRMKKLTSKSSFCISTKTRKMVVDIIDNNFIKVNMGVPEFFLDYVLCKNGQDRDSCFLSVMESFLNNVVVSMGNLHFVILVHDIDIVDIDKYGLIISNNIRLFPNGINVNFMQVINYKCIRLRVFERGVGETQSCGSGACASVAAGIYWGMLCNHVKVDLLGGSLLIDWEGVGNELYMTGPATHVYDGYINC